MDAVRKTDEAEDPWVSLPVATEIRGKGRLPVLFEALDGRIRHQKVAGRRFFHRADLERLRAENAETEDAED